MMSDMKSLPVGEIKAQFSEVLEKVRQGESFGILYGKKNIAYIDALFFASGSATQSGLNTYEFSNGQLLAS